MDAGRVPGDARAAAVTRYTSATDADRAGDARRDRRGLDRGAVRRHPGRRCGWAGALDARRRAVRAGGARGAPRAGRRATCRPRTRSSFLGAGMYDHYVPALVDSIIQRSEFLTPVHAVSARDLPGRVAGDVRVPDRDLRADRTAGLERLGVRGAERGRRRRLRGQARQRPRALRGLPRACIHTRARRCARSRTPGGWRSSRRRWSTGVDPSCPSSATTSARWCSRSRTSSARSRTSTPLARAAQRRRRADDLRVRPAAARRCSSRRASAASTSPSARASRSATGSTSAAPRSASSRRPRR